MFYTKDHFRTTTISSYSFRGKYSFLNLEIQRSHYIRPKVIVHKGEETIQRRKPYEEIRYVNWKCFEKYSYVLALLQFLGFQTKRSSNWLSILENNFKSMNRMFESADQKKTQKFITKIVIEIHFIGKGHDISKEYMKCPK